MQTNEKYSLLLESEDGVLLQVGHVNTLALGDDVRVLPNQQPADVREEHAPVEVVGVGVGLSVLVVHAVVARPLDHVVLEGDGVEQSQDHL